MKKNIYLGLILSAYIGVVPSPLFAEVSPDANITAPEPSIKEPLEPSELQRQQMDYNKANITVPEPSIKEHLEPSELQRQQMEHGKDIAK